MSESDGTSTSDAARALLAHCRKQLPLLKKRLHGVVGSREPLFLDLGARVQDFVLRAEDLGRQVQDVVELTSGETVARLAEQMKRKLQDMSKQCGVLTGQDTSRNLDHVLAAVVRLTDNMRSYNRIIRRLEMLGISTRIESARLGADGLGFHTLADDVQKLADRIATYSEQVHERSQQLSDLAGNALQRTKAVRLTQESCSSKVFATLEENIGKLMDLMAASRGVSESLAPRTQRIAQEFGEIVSSLQFHDITRQQVEHVEEALDDAAGILDNQTEYTLDELVGWVSDLCGLQASQLDNASHRLVEAVERIRGSLRHVAGNVAELGEMTGALGHEEAGEGASVLGNIENAINKVVETMRLMESEGKIMAEVMVSVADTVSHMSVFVEDIENVGAEIELIAINASVKAARTGDKGQALGVLATSIQMLSKEAGAMTDDVTRELNVIADASEHLKKGAESYVDATSVQSFVEELTNLMGNLRQVDSEVSAGFARVETDSATVHEESMQLAESIEFHRDIGEDLERARVDFVNMGQEAQALAPQDGRQGESRLKAMLERYTMETERQVHASALSGTDAAGHEDSAESSQDAPSGVEAEDWDNVELF